MSKSAHNNNLHKWAPLSYPSSCIFSSHTAVTDPTAIGSSVQHTIERTPNLYFPLHVDVLRAALRELFLLDGRIDARTLRVVRKSSSLCDESCRLREVGVCSSMNQRMPIKSDTSTINIVPVEKDKYSDYSRFKCSEDLVDYVLSQAIEIQTEIAKHQRNDCVSDDKEMSSCEYVPRDNAKELQTVASKRKVSDAEEQDGGKSAANFPSHVMELVQSNILELYRAPASSASGENCAASTSAASSRLIPISGIINSEVQNAIAEFLRYPRLQKLQQQKDGNASPFFVLPRLLNASIIAESNLRTAAHAITSSILDSIAGTGTDLDVPLRMFLGYKTNKMSRAHLMDILSQILFDVSHAMYAWTQTEDEMKMLAAKNNREMPESAKKGNTHTIEMKSIKQSLFDKRALQLIGGFEPSSLLPLALGIRHCRENSISWEEYALTVEGKKAMEIHLPQDFFVKDGDGSSQKRQLNSNLFEVGKRRRGRRGRSWRVQKDELPDVAD